MVYMVVLTAAFVFQILHDGYIAHFLFLLAVFFPPVSLLMSLPLLRGTGISLSAPPGECLRGEEGFWYLEIHNRRGIPLHRLQLQLNRENLLTGDRDCQEIRLEGLARGGTRSLPIPTGNCGRIRLSVRRAGLADLSGLFVLPLRRPVPVEALVLPVPREPEGLLEQILEEHSCGKGSQAPGAGEEWELRDYRPGDRMHHIHWKLSGKRDQLVVRELQKSGQPLVLAYGHRGDRERLNRTLDRVRGLSEALLIRGISHRIAGLSAEGTRVEKLVEDGRDLQEFWQEALGIWASPEAEGELRISSVDGPVYTVEPGGDES